MKKLPPDDLADQLKALADPARLQLLALIAEQPDAITADLVEDLGYLTQPTVTHHLKVLRAAGLITGTARGRFVHFRVAPVQLAALAASVRRYTT
jgi:ArsR family transcriptional regulator, arsenate/arsenite/antimonite-responsive transcriptional repressor